MPFTTHDLEDLAAHGVTVDEARRQLRCLATGFSPAELDRPATSGDGIEILDPTADAEAHDAWSKAASAGLLAKFVPASGAASRMFHFLSATLDEDDSAPIADEAVRVLDCAGDFAFAQAWRRALEAGGLDWPPRDRRAIATLLKDEGLGMASWPKGLVDFHRYGNVTRTAFEEHLYEATRLVADASGHCAVHFTLGPTTRERVRAHLRGCRVDGFHFEWSDSLQESSTDTLAVDLDGQPLRDERGRLVFRAGGHGALLGNLERFARESGREVVHVKNVDNVGRDEVERDHLDSRRMLVGLLLRRRAEARRWYERLRQAPRATDLEGAASFCRDSLHRAVHAAGSTEERRQRLLQVLDRPTRVCGMVRNEGEPGGGPFWVRGEDGTCTLQIVEGSQIDAENPAQVAIRDAATHFNPVDLACALRSFEDGEPYELDRFVDPKTAFISRKSWNGRELLALERPGLWNGAMAHWNSIFVEVDARTFHPVKTVLDLLRPGHRDASGS